MTITTKQRDKHKVMRTIKSCQTKNQLLVCEDMIRAWMKLHNVQPFRYIGTQLASDSEYGQLMRLVSDQYRLIEMRIMIARRGDSLS